MPTNPENPPTRAQVVAQTLNRHVEVVLFGTGFMFGALIAIVAGLLS